MQCAFPPHPHLASQDTHLGLAGLHRLGRRETPRHSSKNLGGSLWLPTIVGVRPRSFWQSPDSWVFTFKVSLWGFFSSGWRLLLVYTALLEAFRACAAGRGVQIADTSSGA